MDSKLQTGDTKSCYQLDIMHGGAIYDYFARHRKPPLDFSSNVKDSLIPYHIIKAIKAFLRSKIATAYPDSKCKALKSTILNTVLKSRGIKKSEIVVSCGATQMFFAIAQALNCKKALIIEPSFAEYEKALLQAHCKRKYIAHFTAIQKINCEALLNKIHTIKPNILFVASPSNPSGMVLSFDTLKTIMQAAVALDFTVVLDLSFCDFCLKTLKAFWRIYEDKYYKKHIIAVFSLTKFYALAAFRIGFAFMQNRTRKLVEKCIPTWSVSSLAQVAAIATLKHNAHKNKAKYLKKLRKERHYLQRGLKAQGFTVYKSKANYILFCAAIDNLDKLLKAQGIFIRHCNDFVALDDFFYRVAVKKRKQNHALLLAIKKLKLK